MLNNKREEKFRCWQELVSKFESRSISSTEFCKLHNVSKGGIYKWRKYFLENQVCTKYPSFIPLEIEQNLPNNSCRDEIRVYSSLKVTNSSGLTIEFAEGCKLLELNAIIGVINATK